MAKIHLGIAKLVCHLIIFSRVKSFIHLVYADSIKTVPCRKSSNLKKLNIGWEILLEMYLAVAYHEQNESSWKLSTTKTTGNLLHCAFWFTSICHSDMNHDMLCFPSLFCTAWQHCILNPNSDTWTYTHSLPCFPLDCQQDVVPHRPLHRSVSTTHLSVPAFISNPALAHAPDKQAFQPCQFHIQGGSFHSCSEHSSVVMFPAFTRHLPQTVGHGYMHRGLPSCCKLSVSGNDSFVPGV